MVGKRWVLIDFENALCGSALVRFFLPQIPINRDELARKLLGEVEYFFDGTDGIICDMI